MRNPHEFQKVGMSEKFDFDTPENRRGTNSVKWDSESAPDILPMWVADMDFKTAPAVVEALKARAASGIFGYAKVPGAFYESLINWFARRHSASVRRDWILYTTGVVPAISAIIRALSSPGDKVVVQEPVYNCFFSSIRNNGCEISANPLRLSGNRYEIDFEDLEKKLSDPKAKIFLLCSPHNPSGRVWTREELRAVGELCLRHGVFVISDEIHCDLVLGGRKHTPFLSLGERFAANSATCVSASKAFNLAGLQAADIIAPDECARAKIDRALNVNEVCEISPFAIDAQTAAYSGGEEWLEALKGYLRGNFGFLLEFLDRRLPKLSALDLEATYLPWIDCRATGMGSEQISRLLYEKARVRINPGTLYGKSGDGFIRINIACPRSVLREGLERAARALE